MSLSLRALLTSAGTSFTVTEFSKDAVLFRQGDDCVDVCYIEAGRVRLAVSSSDGREVIPTVLGAGAFVGDDLLAGHQEYRHSAVAIEPTVVLRVSLDRMMESIHTHPGILGLVLEHVMAQNMQLEDTLVHQLLCLGEERLAHTLLMLAECDGAHGRCALPQLSQEVIAEMVGTTRSRVNVFMNRFKKLGFIEVTGDGIYVHPARLPPAAEHELSAKAASAGRVR